MGKRQVAMRGVASIRTMRDNRTDVDGPHRVHMQLAALELEHRRREQERAAMRTRMSVLDRRIEEIDAKRAELRRLLDLRPGDGVEPTREMSEAFCIRY